MFVSLKACTGRSIFNFVLFLSKITFLFKKIVHSLTIKRRNFFQNQNSRKVAHAFVLRRLIFSYREKSYLYLCEMEVTKK